jgi:hypothetical protein
MLDQDEEVELSNEYMTSECSFRITFRNASADTEEKFESLRLCSYTGMRSHVHCRKRRSQATYSE